MAFKLKVPNFKAGNTGDVSGADKPLPLIGHLPFAQQLKLLGAGAALALLVGVVTVALDYRSSTSGAKYLELTGRLQMLTQRVAKDAAASFSGNSSAFEGLEQSRTDITKIMKELDKGQGTLPPTSGPARKTLDGILKNWQLVSGVLDDLEKGRPLLVTLERSTEIHSDMINLSTQIAENASPEYGQKADRMDRLIEQITNTVQMVLTSASTENLPGAEKRLVEARQLLDQLPASDAAVMLLKEDLDGYKNVLGFIAANADGVLTSRLAGNRMLEESEILLKKAESLASDYTEYSHNLQTVIAMVLSGVLLLILLALLAKVYLAEATQRALSAEASNKQNQKAILRLMNELSDLADGDLTVRATVTEDITGAIADSVNYTAEELHKLVSRITEASGQMGAATKDAEALSQRLLESTHKQTEEIKGAEISVQLITQSVGEVDAAAAKAAEVGRHTQEATTRGALAVRNTIAGMDAIREHIQDTSKRIKRLGESSQEIGEIVDLISDITEQTNVLALNAAIQAASAGEAGRGFSVVAEEVQRLAERSAEATKQIGALVKTIQSDTHDAVAAMEKSTLGVVEGAKLSEASGQSLEEIEQVSNQLSALINSISVSTQVQTEMAQEVAAAMQDIMLITEQTTEGTRQSSESAAKVNSMATGLMGSVAGFKL